MRTADILGRVGLLMLGPHVLFIVGVVLLLVGLVLQAGGRRRGQGHEDERQTAGLAQP